MLINAQKVNPPFNVILSHNNIVFQEYDHKSLQLRRISVHSSYFTGPIAMKSYTHIRYLYNLGTTVYLSLIHI